MRLFEVIKIGGKKNPGVDEFMRKYYKVTQAHPFDPSSRIAWDGKSTATVVPFNDHVDLSAVQSLAPGERTGSANGMVMTLVMIADETGVPIQLIAKPFGTAKGRLTKPQLKAWYKRRGFVPTSGDAMEYTPRVKESITEGISPVVYHSVNGIASVLAILAQDRFKLTAAAGTDTERALQKGDRHYYLSTTRHKLGGYHLNPYRTGFILNLDGAKLAQRYAGKAVDYYGPDWYNHKELGGKGPEEKEAEDRIYSYKPFIPNASKYIRAIHILLDPEGYESQKELGVYYRRLAILAKKRDIPLFIYKDKRDWLNQNTKNAVPPTDIDIIMKASAKGRDQRKLYSSKASYFAPWIELYMAPIGAELSKKAKDVRYNYVLYGYGDAHKTLENDMHNAKSKPADETGLETLLKIFRKEKIRTAKEYLELLKKKWAPKDES